jgi:hypothetical protein
VCDRWFSSVAGPTWPNRLYATTGAIADRVHVELPGELGKALREAPIHDGKAFTRWLKKDHWRWYPHDPATLRLIDSAYRPGGDPDRYSDANFAYSNRRTLLEWRTFLGDASGGRLRRVSWIDPNFVDVRILGPPGSNDDHPPSRVMLGQVLVLELLLAITQSWKAWEKTLPLSTYDEHGGFYDHVWPGDVACPGEEGFPLGVRVPALVVSPWVPQRVSHTTFDHTTIIRRSWRRSPTRRAAEAYVKMGPRVRAANDLGDLLSLDAPREPPRDELYVYALADTVVKWKHRANERNMQVPTRGEEGSEALSDLQSEIVAAANKLRADGIPPGNLCGLLLLPRKSPAHAPGPVRCRRENSPASLPFGSGCGGSKRLLCRRRAPLPRTRRGGPCSRVACRSSHASERSPRGLDWGDSQA